MSREPRTRRPSSARRSLVYLAGLALAILAGLGISAVGFPDVVGFVLALVVGAAIGLAALYVADRV